MNHLFSYKADKIALIIIFILAIYIPLFTGVIQPDQLSSSIEKRELATPPSFPNSAQLLNKYPQAFNLYYSDHFGLREQLTATYFSFIYKTRLLNSVNEVTFGKDGWMFLGDIKPGFHKFDDPMGHAINKNRFSKQQLKDFAQSIMAIKNWLKNKNIEYIYLIVPNKHSIYFEKLPSYISKQNGESATDQLISYLQKYTDINIIDLRPALLEEKKNHQVFFKADSHWTFYGANAAQFELMKKVEILYPTQIKPIFLKDKQFKISTRTGGDLAKLAKNGFIVEKEATPLFKSKCTEDKSGANKAVKSYNCNKQGLNTVIFRDSFFNYLKPYVARYFRRSTYIPGRINFKTLKKYIEIEKPNIVIEEIVERKLPYIPQYNLDETI